MGNNIVDKVTDLLYSSEKAADWWSCKPPSVGYSDVVLLIEKIRCVLFPHVFCFFDREGEDEKSAVEDLLSYLKKFLSVIADDESQSCAEQILLALPKIKKTLLNDALSIYKGDPAADSLTEVILCYPGFRAVMIYRISHLFLEQGYSFVARMISEYAHEKTGIDIHPGAQIGESFCIDHGTGVVIGETAVIGNRVKIYQGVTIGAKSFAFDSEGRAIRGNKRHPTIGDDCVIYAGATILGGDTVVGNASIIGGNVWLTHSVPDGSRIYYKEK